MIFVTNKIKNYSKSISIAIAIILALFLPCLAQAAQGEEAAAINAFKTFVKYAQTQEGRAWNYFTAESQDLFAQMSADAVLADADGQALMQKEGLSRQDLVRLIKVELAKPNSEMAKACWTEASKYFPTEDVSNVELTAVVSGNTAIIRGPGSATSLTMIKENGQWKVDALSAMEQQ